MTRPDETSAITGDWHQLSAEDAAASVRGDLAQGLSAAEAADRRQRVGPNVLTGRRRTPAWQVFLSEFSNPLVIVLLVAGAITLALHHVVDAGVIFGVVLVNAIVGFIQERRAQAAIEALSQLISVATTVLRDGQPTRVPAEELVPGDIVVLEAGDRVPADLRLHYRRDLHVNESMLTGESLPVAKETGSLPGETGLAERKNMAYSGTLVTYGKGAGVVVATGVRTELGRISELIESAEALETPLTRNLTRFSKILTLVIVVLSLATFGVGLLQGHPPQDMFIAAVALAVAAIPEGLPAAVTIILAIGVTRMARRNAVIRHLPAVETLGSTTVICSDKTGTLTKNEMTVVTISAGGRHYAVTGTGYAAEGQVERDGVAVSAEDARALRGVLQAGVLCNDARLVTRDGAVTVEGDPTEGALLPVAVKAGLDPDALRAAHPALDVIPFASERLFMATLHEIEHERVIYLKGAVERVVARCRARLEAGGVTGPIDGDAVRQEADALASQGLRVLAFAMKPAPADKDILHLDDVEGDLVFLGLQGMIDPPRPEAIAAVQACRNAGIAVKMITGDHALTARAIAGQLGLGDGHPEVINGDKLAAISDDDLPDAAARTDVFARVEPEQKLRLVRALQSRGAVVAMTGDGVNDAPALKQANIGVAMGITGTEAAKDAADMVLTDDNFASIEAAVEEGRGVYDNLRKFITWTLPTNGGEGLLVVAAIALNQPLPVEPAHLLWINLTTAVALGMMLAFEPKEPGLMRRPARDPKEPVLTPVLVTRLAYVSLLMVIGAFLLFEYELAKGVSTAAARTVVTNVIVFVEMFFLFNCRSLIYPATRLGLFTNPWIILGVLGMVLLQLGFVYLPFMQSLFKTAAVPPQTWLDVLAIAVAIYTIVEIEKWVRRRRGTRA